MNISTLHYDMEVHNFSDAVQTPDGQVKWHHWANLLRKEYGRPNLRTVFKLTESHLKPKGYQTMNVKMAFEVCHQMN